MPLMPSGAFVANPGGSAPGMPATALPGVKAPPQATGLDPASAAGPGIGGAATTAGVQAAMPADAQMQPQPQPQMQPQMPVQGAPMPAGGPMDQPMAGMGPETGVAEQPLQPGTGGQPQQWQPGVEGSLLYSNGMGPITGQVPKMASGGLMCGSSSSGCGVFPLNSQKSKKPIDGHATGLIMRKAGLDALSVVDLAQKAERAGEVREDGYDDALDGNNNGPAPRPRSSNSTGGLLGNKSANLRTSAVGEGNFHIKEVPWSRQGADAWPDKSNYWNRESGNRQGSTKTKISTLLELPFLSPTAHGFLLKCSELCISEEHFMQLCEKAAELDPVIADDLAPLMKSAAGPWLGCLFKSRGVDKGIGETMKTAAGTPGFDPNFMGPVRPAPSRPMRMLTRESVPKMKTYTGFPGSGIPGGTLIGGGKSLLGGLRRGFGGARSAVKSLFSRGAKAVPKSTAAGAGLPGSAAKYTPPVAKPTPAPPPPAARPPISRAALEKWKTGNKSLDDILRSSTGAKKPSILSRGFQKTKGLFGGKKPVQPGFPAPLSGAGPSTLKPGLLEKAKQVLNKPLMAPVKGGLIGVVGGTGTGGLSDIAEGLGDVNKDVGEAFMSPFQEGSRAREWAVPGAVAGSMAGPVYRMGAAGLGKILGKLGLGQGLVGQLGVGAGVSATWAPAAALSERGLDFVQGKFTELAGQQMVQKIVTDPKVAPFLVEAKIDPASINTPEQGMQVITQLAEQGMKMKKTMERLQQVASGFKQFAAQVGIPPETIAQIESGLFSQDAEANKRAIDQLTGLMSQYGEKASQLGFLGDPKIGFLTKLASVVFGLEEGNAIYDWLAPMNNVQQGVLLGGLGSMLLGLIAAVAGSGTGAALGIGGGLLAGGLAMYGNKLPGIGQYFGGPITPEQPIQPEPTQPAAQPPEIPGAPPPMTELERSTGEFTR